jgi:SAM-dependent methyltransferase
MFNNRSTCSIFCRVTFFLVSLQWSALCFGFLSNNKFEINSGRLYDALNANENENEDFDQDDAADSTLSRRRLLKAPVTLVGLAAYGYICVKSLKLSSRDEITYPAGHEQRVTSVILRTFQSAANNFRSIQSRPFRVLEVGIGQNCRLVRRGLYDVGIQAVHSNPNVKSIELSGVDFRLPNEINYQKSRNKLNELSEETGMPINFAVVDGSLTDRSSLPWEDGYFDAIICSLTLCSVDDAYSAINNMKRLLRPHGGTLGYVEHVAVNDSELNEHRFLEVQQRVLDPLQQALVDNCHLHRYNDHSIRTVFDDGSAIYLEKDRFYVDDMWPVCCQCSGVIQLI